MKDQSTWNPEQYKKFAKERDKPFFDLMSLVRQKEGMHVVDLGSGTGELTQKLHQHMKAASTLGIDTSDTMLAETPKFQSKGLEFRKESVEDFHPQEKYDLIFSNAALQWVHDHETLFKRLSTYLNDKGQIAIQMPSNYDSPNYTATIEVATDEYFSDKIDLSGLPGVLTIEEYANALYDNGFKEQMVKMEVYGHVMESSDSIVEWSKGSILTYYKRYLSQQDFDLFVEKYRKKIHDHFGRNGQVFFPFKRILLWAQK